MLLWPFCFWADLNDMCSFSFFLAERRRSRVCASGCRRAKRVRILNLTNSYARAHDYTADGANRQGLPCKAARKFRCEHCRIRSSKSALSTIEVRRSAHAPQPPKTRNLGGKEERTHLGTSASSIGQPLCPCSNSQRQQRRTAVPAATASVSSAGGVHHVPWPLLLGHAADAHEREAAASAAC